MLAPFARSPANGAELGQTQKGLVCYVWLTEMASWFQTVCVHECVCVCVYDECELELLHRVTSTQTLDVTGSSGGGSQTGTEVQHCVGINNRRAVTAVSFDPGLLFVCRFSPTISELIKTTIIMHCSVLSSHTNSDSEWNQSEWSYPAADPCSELTANIIVTVKSIDCVECVLSRKLTANIIGFHNAGSHPNKLHVPLPLLASDMRKNITCQIKQAPSVSAASL